jgi:hypothetical protein
MSADRRAPLTGHSELPVLECQGCDNLPHGGGATICHTPHIKCRPRRRRGGEPDE